MKIVKKTIKSFCYGAVISLICILVIELILNGSVEGASVLTPEFAACFPTDRIAVMVDVLLYGVIAAGFNAMSFWYELERLGFVIQNILYCLSTAIIWIPIITWIWRLYLYPQALICAVVGFLVTYAIVIPLQYQALKKDVEEVNRVLAQADSNLR